MRNVSLGFLEEVVKPSRTVDAKIVINGYIITSNDIISYEITSSLTDNDMPTIGSAVASSVKFEVTKSSLPMIYVGQKLEFYAGLLVNGAMEWVRVGTFKTTAEYVTKKKLTVEIEAFDEMFWLGNTIYESDLSYPTTVATMMSELVSKYGLSFSPDMYAFEERRTHESLEAFTYGELEAYWYQPRITDDIVFHIDPTEQEYSIRSILSQMALLTSSNVVIDSFGDIVFRFLKPTNFKITGENYVDYKRLSEGDIYISQLISRNPELEQTFVSGANTGVTITVENSGIVSQVQNDDIRNRVYPLTYTPYDMTCQGMPHLEIGDTVRFIEVDNTESVLFIVNYSFEYNGGFRNKFTVKAPEKDNVETTPFRSASSSVSGETIRLTNQTLEQAIANASELITGNAGGHVVTVTDPITGKPQELLILVDSDDVNTATQLWRWNAGGLGFSSTGYDGTYALAMTSDGKIVADAINASELSAISANLGTVTAGRIEDGSGVNYWDLNTGDMNLNEIKIAGKKVSVSLSEVDGRALNAQATADAVTLSFTNQKIGTRNLIKGSQEHFRSLNAGVYATSVGESVLLSEYSISTGDKVTFSVWILAPYSIGAMARLDFANSSGGTIEAHFGNVISGGQDGLSHVTATVPPGTTSIGINIASEAYGVSESTVQIRKEKLEEGTKPTAWLPHHNEIKTLTHVFDNQGYAMKDSNGAEIVSISKGIANEQNIGRVDNVEEGFPMKIPFHIGSEVSQITQAVLKWDMSQFRTYSKGAASGGGTKTTPSGGAGTAGITWGSSGVAEATSAVTAGTLPHQHTIALSKLAHSHSTPSHTHSMDITHSHDPVFGILETGITVDYIVGITVDGVYRAQVNATRGEIDLSAWITTNGWHELILSVNGIKRLDANLFLKTYIRR